MTQELTALPETFSAGTTVRYSKSFSDYPAWDWSLKLYLNGAGVLVKTATATGDTFDMALEPTDTSPKLPAGLYRWTERVSNEAGEVYEVASGLVRITSDAADATPGSEQDFSERAIVALQAHIEGRLPAGMETIQIAGRAVSKIPAKDAVDLLRYFEGRLAHLADPEFVIRPVLISFVPPGMEQ